MAVVKVGMGGWVEWWLTGREADGRCGVAIGLDRVGVARRFWAHAQAAAEVVCGDVFPTVEYRDRAARLVFGTAAHESDGFRYRRQVGDRIPFVPSAPLFGAYGLCQMESGAIADCVAWLQKHREAAARVAGLLYQDRRAELYAAELVARRSLYDWAELLTLEGGDLAAAVLCRVYYLTRPGAIPESDLGRADYWKREWNTDKGSGTVEKFMGHWFDWAPVITETA